MEAKHRHRVDQSSQDSDELGATQPPEDSPTNARPRARKSYLWGCVPDTQLTTLGQLVIVWGGTAVVVGILFLVMLQTPCEPGMGKAECPGYFADRGMAGPAGSKSISIPVDLGTKRPVDHLTERPASHPTEHHTEQHTEQYTEHPAGHPAERPTERSASHTDHTEHPAATEDAGVFIRTTSLPADKTTVSIFRVWPNHDDFAVQDAHYKSTQGAAPPHHEMKIRAKTGSSSVDLPGSVFITFKPSEFTAGTKSTTTSKDISSAPPVISSAVPQPGGVSGGGSDGYDSTTTIVDFTTVHPSGSGAEAGATHTTKASGGSILSVQLILGGVWAVLLGAFLSC